MLDGAQVFALGEGQSSVIQRDGKTMGSYEQRYCHFSRAKRHADSAQRQRYRQCSSGRRYSHRTQTVRVGTQEQRITVRPIPAEYPPTNRGCPLSPSQPPWILNRRRLRPAMLATPSLESDGYRYWQYRHQCRRPHSPPTNANSGSINNLPTSKTKPLAKNLVGYRVETVNLGSHYARRTWRARHDYYLVEYRHRKRDDHGYPVARIERYRREHC